MAPPHSFSVAVLLSFVIISSNIRLSLQDCDRPTNLAPNVTIDPDQATYVTWTPIVLSCEAGFSFSGPQAPSYCYSSSNPSDPGYWSPDPGIARCYPKCLKPTFADPSVVITPDQPAYDTNDDITFTCNSGSLEGPTTSRCENDGTWDYVNEPRCLAMCDAPANTNGTGQYSHNTVATFQCDAGYDRPAADDPLVTTCAEGEWRPLADCVKIEGCLPPTVPVYATYVSATDDKPGSTGFYSPNSRVNLACNEMERKTPSGPLYSYCNDTGGWDPDPTILKCRDKCTTPSFVDSRLQHTSKQTGDSGEDFYDHSDTLVFSCEGGIYVDGPWRSTCKNGAWSTGIGGYRPVCRSNCTAPINMSNAGKAFHHGRAHVFECDATPGMVRMGGPRSVCVDGVWKPMVRCDLKTNLRREL